MEEMNVIQILAGATVAGFVIWTAAELIFGPWPAKRIVQNLAGREEIDVEAVLARRFPGGEVDLAEAVELWNALAECYAVAPGLLRLTDRFNEELDSKRIFQYDDENSSVNLMLERFYGKRGLAVELSNLYTVEDCIAALGKPGEGVGIGAPGS